MTIKREICDFLEENKYGQTSGQAALGVYGEDTPHNRKKIDDWGSCLAGGRTEGNVKPLLFKRIQLGPNEWVYSKLTEWEKKAFELRLAQEKNVST